MRARLAAGMLVAGLLAAACGVEAQDEPEPLDLAPSPPAPTPTVSERLILPKAAEPELPARIVTRSPGCVCGPSLRPGAQSAMDRDQAIGGELTMNGDAAIGETHLHVEITWRDERAVVAVTGEVDLASAPRLSAALDEVIANPPPSVEVDLSGISFFSCRGLSVLMEAHQRLAERGAVLIVPGASHIVRRVFTASGLHGLLTHGHRDHKPVTAASVVR